MKILFLTYHGFNPASGITKKMLAQIEGLRQNGHEVHVCTYDTDEFGNHCRFVDDKIICTTAGGTSVRCVSASGGIVSMITVSATR